MKPYVLFAIPAGVAWGLGGYFEKAGLRAMGLPPVAGIVLVQVSHSPALT